MGTRPTQILTVVMAVALCVLTPLSVWEYYDLIPLLPVVAVLVTLVGIPSRRPWWVYLVLGAEVAIAVLLGIYQVSVGFSDNDPNIGLGGLIVLQFIAATAVLELEILRLCTVIR